MSSIFFAILLANNKKIQNHEKILILFLLINLNFAHFFLPWSSTTPPCSGSMLTNTNTLAVAESLPQPVSLYWIKLHGNEIYKTHWAKFPNLIKSLNIYHCLYGTNCIYIYICNNTDHLLSEIIWKQNDDLLTVLTVLGLNLRSIVGIIAE